MWFSINVIPGLRAGGPALRDQLHLYEILHAIGSPSSKAKHRRNNYFTVEGLIV